MRKMLKNKKKKGFTLIEMVAVVAIIGILAAILVPKITGYMNEAKKTGVIDQARKVTQAAETAVMKGKLTEANANAVTVGAISDPTMLSLLDVSDATAAGSLLDKLPSSLTIAKCKKIVNDKEEFEVDANGKFTKFKNAALN